MQFRQYEAPAQVVRVVQRDGPSSKGKYKRERDPDAAGADDSDAHRWRRLAYRCSARSLPAPKTVAGASDKSWRASAALCPAREHYSFSTSSSIRSARMPGDAPAK
jgi:hypothetical protein